MSCRFETHWGAFKDDCSSPNHPWVYTSSSNLRLTFMSNVHAFYITAETELSQRPCFSSVYQVHVISHYLKDISKHNEELNNFDILKANQSIKRMLHSAFNYQLLFML